VVSPLGVLGRLSPPYAQPWPPFVPFPLDAVVIEFTCGYGDIAESVPQKVKQAMNLLVSHWYENRVPLSETGQAPGEISFAVSALLQMDRIYDCCDDYRKVLGRYCSQSEPIF
jgi:Phage QLRG family, putative DNA packaging.